MSLYLCCCVNGSDVVTSSHCVPLCGGPVGSGNGTRSDTYNNLLLTTPDDTSHTEGNMALRHCMGRRHCMDEERNMEGNIRYDTVTSFGIIFYVEMSQYDFSDLIEFSGRIFVNSPIVSLC